MEKPKHSYYFMKFGSDQWDDDFEVIHGDTLEEIRGFFYIFSSGSTRPTMGINKNQVGRWWEEEYEG